MRSSLPLPAVLFGALLFASVASSSISSAPYTAETIVLGASGFEELAGRFEELARSEGGVHAFDILRSATIPPNIDMHLLGHRIGDILYEQEGIEGIALCTDDFRNACSHTMVIGALSDHGESALGAIRDACKRAPGGLGAYTMCYHGLGHGVFAFFDYSMPETIELCGKTGTDDYRQREAVECIGGAVMELSGGGGHDPEAWLRSRAAYIEGDPVAFCLDEMIPENAKEQCFSYLTPELWKMVGIDMGRPDPAQYKYAFALCDAIPSSQQTLRDACYGGFGKEFIPLAADRDIRAVDTLPDEKLRDVVAWCREAGDAAGSAACIEHALHSLFWGGENDPAASLRFCALPDDAALSERCYRVLGENISFYLRGDERARWCSELPEPYMDLCAS